MQEQAREDATLKRVLLLALGHFINDIHASFLPAFVPTLVARLGISITQASFLSSVSGIINMTGQPMLGHLADRTTKTIPLLVGPILSAIGASLIPSSPTYGLAFIFVALWAIGSSTFHPQAQGSIGFIVPPGRLSFSLSIFSTGGILAAAISPLYAVGLYQTVGPKLMPMVTLIPVCAYAFFVLKFLPRIPKRLCGETDTPRAGIFAGIWSVVKITSPALIVATARDTVVQGVRFLLPLVVAAGGGSIADVGTTLFIISIARVGAPMAGGYIADRMNKGTLLCYSVIISTICLVPAALIIGAPSLILYILGVSALEANIAATAAMAQEMAPHARSVASSLSMGFSWGMAELLVVPLGMVADFTNLTTALLVMAVVPLLALPSALKLKKAQSARQFLDTRT